MLFQWRKLDRQGALMAVSAGEAVVPASELAAARAEISKLQRVLGKKTLEKRDSLRGGGVCCRKKVDYALALAARGRPIKAVTRALGLARHHIHDLQCRSADWRDGRVGRTSVSDEHLLLKIR